MLNDPISFTVNVTGANTGEEYKGVFKAKPRLTHRDALRRDQLRRELLGTGENAGVAAVNIADIFSKIWVHVTDAPSWWKDAGSGLDLTDEEPIVEVYEAVVKMEKEAIEAVKKQAESAQKELKAKE